MLMKDKLESLKKFLAEQQPMEIAATEVLIGGSLIFMVITVLSPLALTPTWSIRITSAVGLVAGFLIMGHGIYRCEQIDKNRRKRRTAYADAKRETLREKGESLK